jgi:GAF domain-containing protein
MSSVGVRTGDDMITERFIVDSALQMALSRTRRSLGNVQLIDWKTGFLQIVAYSGFSDQFLQQYSQVKSGDGCACGRALLLRRSVLINDVTLDPRFGTLARVGEKEGFISVLSTPLMSSNGALIGIISTHGVQSLDANQTAYIEVLAQATANELVRCRANGSDIFGSPNSARRTRLRLLGQ